MSALEGFMSVWSRARESFGTGTPEPGATYDRSGPLRHLQRDVQSAAPVCAWTGAGSESYAETTRRQGRILGATADLDTRLATEVDRSAAVVSAGRRDLDAVKQWVSDAASTVPRTATGDRMLWPVVTKGLADITEIMQRSNADLSEIAGRIRGLGDDYQHGAYRDLHGGDAGADVQAVDFDGDHTDQDAGVPDTTLDLADIVYGTPGAPGEPGMMELAPRSGVWVPDPASRGYRPKRPQAPLDLNDIQYRGPGSKGLLWEMELIPGSGAWVPNPNHPGYTPHTPEAPVDLAKIELVDPEPTIPAGLIELWPHSGIVMPNPYLGHPF